MCYVKNYKLGIFEFFHKLNEILQSYTQWSEEKVLSAGY